MIFVEAGTAALAGWVAGADVIEYVPNYFVFVRHGMRLSNERHAATNSNSSRPSSTE